MVSQNVKGYLSVCSGFFLHLVLGSMYTWGSLLPYISSKLHHIDPEVDTESTLWFIPINILATNLLMPVGGTLDKLINKRLLLIIGTLLIGGGNFICAYANYIYIVFIGDFVIGIGTGLVYMTPIKNAWQYFPDKKGLISGIIVCGFGLSSFIFSFIAKAIVNPNNDKVGPDGYYGEDVFSRVTTLFIWLGCIYTGLCLLANILFVEFKIDITRRDSYLVEEKLDLIVDKNTENKETLRTALFSGRFVMLFLMPFLTSTYGFFTVNALKIFGSKAGITDDNMLTWASSLSGLGNGLSRVVWGIFLDWLSFKKTYFIVCTLQLVLACTIYFTPQLSPIMYIIWTFLSLCGEGSHFTIFPAVTKHVFGLKNATEVYGFVFFAYSCGSFLGPILTNYWIKKQDNLIYYLYMFIICGVLNIISAVVCYFFKYEPFEYDRERSSSTTSINRDEKITLDDK